jgi:hypothetical protein
MNRLLNVRFDLLKNDLSYGHGWCPIQGKGFGDFCGRGPGSGRQFHASQSCAFVTRIFRTGAKRFEASKP